MAEDDLVQSRDNSEQEFEIDTDGDDGDLESAMQEALEAVEKASHGSKDGELDGSREAIRDVNMHRSTLVDEDVSRLEEEIADLRDRSARTLADFDNYRKRIDREREDERRYATFDIMREFLAVVDNLERALAADGSDQDLKVGVELILRQMKDLMKSVGVERVEAVGEEFDPRYHEAVTQHQDPEVTTPTVSAELQAGYLMHDRLLRPAVVKVAMPANGEPDIEPAEDA